MIAGTGTCDVGDGSVRDDVSCDPWGLAGLPRLIAALRLRQQLGRAKLPTWLAWPSEHYVITLR
jgi:hypothetical protein